MKMTSSEDVMNEKADEKFKMKSSVTIMKNDGKRKDNYKSDGELDDESDDSDHENERNMSSKVVRHEREDANDDDDDDDESYRRRRKKHYSSDEDKTKYESKKRYNDDEEDRYSKSRRRYSSDEDRYDDNKNVRNSRHDDDDESDRRRRKDDRYDRYERERKNYVDLDRPQADEDEYYQKELKRRRHKEKRRQKSPVKDKSKESDKKDDTADEQPVVAKKPKVEDIFSKAGGAYIPPSKLRQMQEGLTDKTSVAYQRMSWEALKKSIVGLINKVNASNMDFIVKEILEENIVRGRGLFSQSVIRAQVASPTFTNVYACLTAVINTRFPNIGELILRRLIIQFRKSFKRNDKPVCINSAKFIAHLVNQQVAHELLALEILTLLLHNHTGDSVEVAVSFLKDVGQKLIEVSPKGVNAVFERLRNILHDSSTEKRIQYMIEVIFHIRRDNFQSFPAISEGLDQIEEDEQITHLLRLDDSGTSEDILNVFKQDPNFAENEDKYKQIKNEIIGSDDSSSDEDGDDEDDDEESGDEDEEKEKEEQKQTIVDLTETNLVELRRLIYLTIQSSLDFEECAHKMMKFDLKDGQQHEFCAMVVECCAQQRSYEKFYGLLAQRFCLLRKEFMEQFMVIFSEQYENCHHLDTGKLRNTAKLFSHLLISNAIPWTVVQIIKLTEADTTSSSRIFIKILFQELAEYLGIPKLLTRLKDPSIEVCLDGVFPRDNPNDTRFAINFFTAIGLGILTEELREHLKTIPKPNPVSAAAALLSSSSSSSSSSGSSDSDDSDSSSSESSSESDSSATKNKKKTKKASDKETKRTPPRSSSEKRKDSKKSRDSKDDYSSSRRGKRERERK